MLDGLKTGDKVRVYYEYPFAAGAVTVQVNGLVFIFEGTIEDFTDAEIDFINQNGYTIKQ